MPVEDPLHDYLASLPDDFDRRLPDLCWNHYQTVKKLGVKRTLDRMLEEFPVCTQCVKLAKQLQSEGLAYDEARAMEQAVAMFTRWVERKREAT